MNQTLILKLRETYHACMQEPSGDYSPTIRRRRLSEELRRLRLARGLTLEQVAEKLEWSRAKIANIETGKRLRPYVTDVELLLNVYGVDDPDQRAALLDLTRQSRTKGWWASYGGLLGDYVGMEAEASSIATYQLGAIPGLLQTFDYAVALAQAMRYPPEDVERIAASRVRRQQLFARKNPPRFHAVIDEAALIRPAAPDRPDVMRAQIHHLINRANDANVTLQLLPFTAGLHAGVSGPFVLLEFPDPADRPVVYLETRAGGHYLEDTAEITEYQDLFTHLHTTALSHEATVARLAQLAE